MTSRPPARKPTLEELLRVKRAERPPADFWPRFEEELRAKQLAAIVAKRPWWHAFSHSFSARPALLTGLGAVAAAGVAFVGLRPGPVEMSPVQSTLVAHVASQAEAPVAPEAVPALPFTAAPTAVVAAEMPSAPVETIVAEPASAETTTVASVVHPTVVEVKFSEVQVPPPLVALETVSPAALVGFAGTGVSIAATEPLTTVPSPREQRMASLASFVEVAMLTMPTTSLRSRSTPRESDLRDREISRVSAQGNAFELKFW